MKGAGLMVLAACSLWIGSAGAAEGLGVDGALAVGVGAVSADDFVGVAVADGASAGTPAMTGFSVGATPFLGRFGEGAGAGGTLTWAWAGAGAK